MGLEFSKIPAIQIPPIVDLNQNLDLFKYFWELWPQLFDKFKSNIYNS